MPAQPPPIASKALEANFLGHELGPDCFALFSSIFLDALKDSRKNSKVVSQTVEALLAYADKLVSSLTPQTLPRYGDVEFFEAGQRRLPKTFLLTIMASRNKFGSWLPSDPPKK